MRNVVLGLAALTFIACSDVTSEERTTSSDVLAADGFRSVDITSGDGTVLKALVIEPASAGPAPAIVLPSSWGLFDGEYVVQAKKLAAAGYVVVSYTPRGWWNSGGEVDTAGPKDVADARAVVDWVLRSTSADRVGMAGVSYGAGISLLAAAADSRVRAVAALSGWTDLVASIFGDNTRRLQTVSLLELTAKAVGRPSAEFTSVLADFHAKRNIPALKAWGAVRGAGFDLAELNQNKPALLIANAYGDSIFPPNQLVDFMGSYGGPKRLELRPGDHAIPEATGLVGLPNGAWDSLRAWMDGYLATSNGTTGGIELHSQSGGDTETYASWADVSRHAAHFDLGFGRTAFLDRDTVAYGGIALVSGALDALTGVAPFVQVDLVDQSHAAVWEGADGALAIRGIPSLHLELTPSHANGTLVAYLYDVNAAGAGRLITQAPSSWLEQTPNTGITLDLNLPATDYDIAGDHHLALVLDGKDALYIDENTSGSSVTFSNATLDLPLK
jgi:pimeloyl-ACP methyl ester carboxylesterase